MWTMLILLNTLIFGGMSVAHTCLPIRPFEDLELTTCLERTRSQAESLGPAKLREAMARSRIEQLSGREREVLSAVASGLSNQLIANQLGISCRTVESHRANILNKIGATHISEAIRVAIEASLVH